MHPSFFTHLLPTHHQQIGARSMQGKVTKHLAARPVSNNLPCPRHPHLHKLPPRAVHHSKMRGSRAGFYSRGPLPPRHQGDPSE
eukprot:5367264-Pleurochrysis_carterae.AAC.1